MSTKKDKFTKKDTKYMKLALDLAKAKHGLTGTNPSVGCVIVKKDKIISIGQTGYNGRPHAEYNAIKNSIQNLKDAKMYVTLEPCNHYGQTPPCTNLIIRNKFQKVFYGLDDIDKKVKKKTQKILKSNNIEVKKGLMKSKLKEFYYPYFFNRTKKIPFTTGKIAVSKNNLIYSKNNKKITNIYSDKITHLLRYKNDSIMVSYKTLNIDNPRLNCRIKGLEKFSPKRIILDNNLDINTNSYIFKTANTHNTIIFYNKGDKKKIILLKKKIQLIKSKLIKKRYFDLYIILKKLYKLGCRNLLVEGGNDLSSSFLKQRLFNKFFLFQSQKTLSKSGEYKDFKSLKNLYKNYKNSHKINTKLGKDLIKVYNK